ncbi:DUF3822 family protein [Lutibacter sp.]|uniref:DUF3822 family protein n=1 Tax=Lutibacter sp. TaxID=1925666 RepID=UPI00273502BF|nr:DUF3822 family protein [Lutibacter sp.]MDP3313076.1 DUF3822 family protein [Lutibacter sp.]
MKKEEKKIIRNNRNLELNNLEDKHLSIQLSLDGFSFCIYNKVNLMFENFNEFSFSLPASSPYKHLEFVEEIFSSEPLLQPKYKSVSVTHFNNLATQVPAALFDKKLLNTYLKYSVKVLENDYITYDKIDNSEIINVYIPFVNINNFLLEKYGAFNFKHSSTILIENLLGSFKNSENKKCFVNVYANNFEIVVLNGNKLELFNCFNFKTKEDFIYYILFTAEQLKLNPEEFELFLMGDIEKDSELYSITYKYIRNVKFYEPSQFPTELSELPKHSNFTLLNNN